MSLQAISSGVFVDVRVPRTVRPIDDAFPCPNCRPTKILRDHRGRSKFGPDLRAPGSWGLNFESYLPGQSLHGRVRSLPGGFGRSGPSGHSREVLAVAGDSWSGHKHNRSKLVRLSIRKLENTAPGSIWYT